MNIRNFRCFSTISFFVVVLSAINLAYMHCVCAENFSFSGVELWQSGCFILFDLFALYSVMIFISFGRSKLADSIFFVIVLLWSMTNVIYYRFFHTYFNYHSIINAQNMIDGVVVKSIGGEFVFSDIIWLFTLSSFVIYIKNKRLSVDGDGKSYVARVLVPIAICGFLSVSFVVVGVGIKGVKDMVYVVKHPFSRVTNLINDVDMRDSLCAHKGVVCGQIFNDYISYTKDYELSELDKGFVISYADSLQKRNNFSAITSGARNIIFILTESYMSFTSDLLIDGKPVTPYLNMLKHTPGVYYNGKMQSNIELGQSFDGQMIYMTGLLPLTTEISAPKVLGHKMQALPKLLKDAEIVSQAYATIPTDKKMWFQDRMNTVYSIDSLFCFSSSAPVSDEMVFERAIKEESTFSDCFFHLILTISTHLPYDDHELYDMWAPVCDFHFPTDYSQKLCNYLVKCNYMDYAIGKYIDSLKERGLYDSSLLIIASDHQAFDYLLEVEPNMIDNHNLPFYIINSGFDEQNAWHGLSQQIDVFTTLVDVLGIQSLWQGVGCTLSDKDRYENRNTEDAHRVSTLLINSDFLRNYEPGMNKE